jgi:hypothetical protein
MKNKNYVLSELATAGPVSEAIGIAAIYISISVIVEQVRTGLAISFLATATPAGTATIVPATNQGTGYLGNIRRGGIAEI